MSYDRSVPKFTSSATEELTDDLGIQRLPQGSLFYRCVTRRRAAIRAGQLILVHRNPLVDLFFKIPGQLSKLIDQQVILLPHLTQIAQVFLLGR